MSTKIPISWSEDSGVLSPANEPHSEYSRRRTGQIDRCVSISQVTPKELMKFSCSMIGLCHRTANSVITGKNLDCLRRGVWYTEEAAYVRLSTTSVPGK